MKRGGTLQPVTRTAVSIRTTRQVKCRDRFMTSVDSVSVSAELLVHNMFLEGLKAQIDRGIRTFGRTVTLVVL